MCVLVSCLKSKLKTGINRSVDFTVKRWAKTLKRGQDPEKVKQMPVFQFVGKNLEKKTRVYTWGSAETGALGIANLVKPSDRFKKPRPAVWRPLRLTFFNLMKVYDVGCGYGFSVFAAVASDTTKRLFGTGINTDSQIGYHESENKKFLGVLIKPSPIDLPIYESTKVKKVSCGRAHTVCLTSDNELFSLGNNAYGQCGRPIIEKEIFHGSRKVNKIYGIDEKVSEVVCGQDHTLFLTENGSVYSCGWGADGQTGLGHYGNAAIPTKVKGDIEGEKIVSLSSSADSVLACNEKGDVFGWGNSEYNQLHVATSETQLNIPRHLPLKNIGKVKQVAAGGTMCLVVNESGQVYVWGYGILGKGPEVAYIKDPSLIPEPLFGCNEFNTDVKVKSVTASLSHCAAITNKGDLYMWGRNRNHCLGLDNTNDQFFPLRVPVPITVVKASLGVDHTVVLGLSLL
ncbi:Williams-Beuren syndrome chromosomal region 16 protein-like protein [Dinothrombium tinctorium]|uniref:Williams-Beuren syndrome chromosomal region 16 protein-like protein n=1 Tax=Dinothrombium tinctorium TaxID=1965070 RepID=A0A3S3P159_9ACAR|nr:Williams-Beuren syndrome chromosomal region 16 protein-like protein [Dinothrombium tinctorium]